MQSDAILFEGDFVDKAAKIFFNKIDFFRDLLPQSRLTT